MNFIAERDIEMVENNGRWYLVWREHEGKGSEYLFCDLNVGIIGVDEDGTEELVEAYWEAKYGREDEE